MKKTLMMMVAACIAASLLCSCEDSAARRKALKKEKKAKPTFLFWCFRKEILDADYHVPNMSTPAAAQYLQNKLKGLPGIENGTFNLETHVITISYQSSTIRQMNIEEAIAQAGFAVNNRPADPKAKVPEGLK
jgi:copper chaperone CopZ